MNDPFKVFLKDRTHRTHGVATTVSDLYEAFAAWCAEQQIPCMQNRSFRRRLRGELGFKPQMTPGGYTVVMGVALKPVPERRPMLVLPAGLTADDVVALTMIAAERARQIAGEGHQPDGDDAYRFGELARAGGAYLDHAGCDPMVRASFETVPPGLWPFPVEAWKPKTPERDAVRGAALGVAFLASLIRNTSAKG